MRTLVVSDLHVGAGRGRSALEDPATRRTLVAAISRSDRLVLLGDTVELRERPLRDALAAASRVLPELVGGLPAGGEVVLLPGNHDHQLIVPHLSRRGATVAPAPLRVDHEADWVAGEPLAEIVGMLACSGASVSVRYPGVWLRDDVFAHHGHYLDRHTTTPAFERLAAGAMARVMRSSLSQIAGVDDYERVLGPLYAWLFAVAQGERAAGPEADRRGGSTRVLGWVRGARRPGAWVAAAGLRGTAGLLSAAGLGPLSGDLSGAQLRRAALFAYGQVLAALKLTPSYALFGHTHRAGPLPRLDGTATDQQAGWTTPAGVRLLNCGGWVNEPSFFGTGSYRPGFAIELDDLGAPRLVNLLDPA